MIRGTLHPIGTRVRVLGGGHEMLVVDLDPERNSVIAAWKSGDCVSEREFPSIALDSVQGAAAA